MRLFLPVLMAALSIHVVLHAQVTGDQLLAQEPEWIRITGVKPAPYSVGGYRTSPLASAVQNYGRYKGVEFLVKQLSERLFDDLLVCSGGCQNQAAKEDEFWIVQHQLPSYGFSPMLNRIDARVDERWEEKDPDWEPRRALQETCDEMAGIKEGEEYQYWDNASDRSVLQKPEKVQQYHNCQVELLAIGFKYTGIDTSHGHGLWATHAAIWKYCVAKYRVDLSMFQQAPYNACMNRYDMETIMRTKHRLNHGRHGEAMGQLPTDKDLAQLSRLAANFKP